MSENNEHRNSSFKGLGGNFKSVNTEDFVSIHIVSGNMGKKCKER